MIFLSCCHLSHHESCIYSIPCSVLRWSIVYSPTDQPFASYLRDLRQSNNELVRWFVMLDTDEDSSYPCALTGEL
uniref:Uncharacterized protein n=1 Tax=Physcomitrium patens TaxID=3218 RepID=A0A2K1I9W1_PHYPA|nr:hypothetical protein PHYPA_031178 [Physcomitrium patens]PNR40587.1 hypothetical protein PHYPA_017990 [Physcomitrium patens]